MTKPYYTDDYCTIYHGDCMDILPTLPKVDLVLTDPPYGVNLNPDNTRFSGGSEKSKSKRGNATSSKHHKKILGDSFDFNPSFLTQYGKRQIIWGWNNYPDKLPRGACLVWIKKNSNAFGTFLGDAELAWLSSGYGVFCHKDLSLQAEARTRKHPTQKPLSLMRWCISHRGGNPDIILDPFMGSGTTLVAAHELRKKSIGIELEEKYCEIAAKRLQQEVLAL